MRAVQMEICGTFNIDQDENVKLDGKYEIQCIKNENATPDLMQNINCQAVYFVGNVLVRTNTEGVQDLIKTFIRYTYDPCEDLDLDLSIKADKQMRWGTICPTRKVLFTYKNKIFIAYGRYIFGYDHNCVTITREGTKSAYTKVIDNCLQYKLTKEHKMTKDEIALCVVDRKIYPDLYEYTFAFLIYDKDTEIVDAFGLYS